MLDVGVIGGGTAGSAAALFLARAGHRVTLYERVVDPSPVGAGITLQPTGQHVLARLGLHDAVVSRGARIDRLVCETVRNTSLFDLTYATVDPDLYGVGLHRGVLFGALHRAVRTEPRITLRLGSEVVDLSRADRSGGRASWLIDVGRQKHGPHELVVVADGARSQLRDDTSTSKRVEPYPWGALWFVAKDPRSEDDPRTRVLHQRVDGNRHMLGLLPTGTPKAERLVSLFWSVRADRVAELRRAGLSSFRDEALRVAPNEVVEAVLDAIPDIDALLFAGYHDVVMHRWHTRNVVYLGDAAHATSPQLGRDRTSRSGTRWSSPIASLRSRGSRARSIATRGHAPSTSGSTSSPRAPSRRSSKATSKRSGRCAISRCRCSRASAPPVAS
jgi:2-polyprenyl-6-methoxyphenol hydroxylase-like FAD-dependent oxidoreductase